MKIEYRDGPAVELRVSDGDDAPKISGLGIPTGKWTDDMGGFREQIAPKAFAESLAHDDIRAVFNHNTDMVIGRVSSETLTLNETKRGVEFEALPPDTGWARDLIVSIRRRDIRENSFGMVVLDDEWVKGKVKGDKDYLSRTVKRAKLIELGPQTFPAYPQSKVQVRSLQETLAQGIESIARSEGQDPDVLRRELELDAVEI